MIFIEKFTTAFETEIHGGLRKPQYVEVFSNPSLRELIDIVSYPTFKFILFHDILYAFMNSLENGDELVYHQDVEDELGIPDGKASEGVIHMDEKKIEVYSPNVNDIFSVPWIKKHCKGFEVVDWSY